MTVVGDWPISVLAAGPSVSSQLFGSVLIGLREGLEAAIVVTILVAFLVKSDRRDALKWVWLGVGAAIAMTVAVFLVIQFGENTISGLAAEAIAGHRVAGRRRDRHDDGALDEEGVGQPVRRTAWRHGARTGNRWARGARCWRSWPSAVRASRPRCSWSGTPRRPPCGRCSAWSSACWSPSLIAYGMYAGAVRINLAKFFKYTGVFLILVAAGILSYGIGALQTVGWLPGLAHRAFDITGWFNWSSWYGEIIQGVFNVTPTPTVLQFVCWLAYLVVVLAFFLRPSAARASPARPRAPISPATAQIRQQSPNPLQPPKGQPREPSPSRSSPPRPPCLPASP